MKKWGIAAAIAVFLAGGGLAIAAVRSSGSNNTAETANATVVYIVESGDLRLHVPASGDIEPLEVVGVRKGTSVPTRTVVEVLVREGDTVGAGETMFVLDDRGLRLDLEGAQARYDAARLDLDRMLEGADERDLADARAALTQAEQELRQRTTAADRIQRLYERDLASAVELEEARSALNVAENRLESARISLRRTSDGATEHEIRSKQAQLASVQNDLDRARLALEETRVRAPVTGTVASVGVRRGDLAGDSVELATIIIEDTMLFRAGVDESDVASIAVGAPAIVEPYGLPNLQLEGTVVGIDQRASSQGNATVFFVDIEVANDEGRLRWGMSADASIIVAELEDVVLVPQGALRRAGRDSAVTVAGAGEETEERIVRTGATDGVMVEVVEGLSAGERIVVPQSAIPTAGRFGSIPGSFGQTGAFFRAVR